MKISTAFAVATAAAIALGATAVLAQQNPIEARQALMKDNGKHAKLAAGMAKGEAPFDLAKAKEIFATFEAAAQKMPDLFPPDSKTGHDTTASPKIWENMDDFKARFVKFGKDAKAAEASVKDLDSFKVAMGGLGKECGGCHENYRIKKN
jgi:cytochrome c556